MIDTLSLFALCLPLRAHLRHKRHTASNLPSLGLLSAHAGRDDSLDPLRLQVLVLPPQIVVVVIVALEIIAEYLRQYLLLVLAHVHQTGHLTVQLLGVFLLGVLLIVQLGDGLVTGVNIVQASD